MHNHRLTRLHIPHITQPASPRRQKAQAMRSPLSAAALLLLAQASHGFLLLTAAPTTVPTSSPMRRPLLATTTAPPSLLPRASARSHLQAPMAMPMRTVRGGASKQQVQSTQQKQQQKRALLGAVAKSAAVLTLAGAVVAGGWWKPAAAWAAKQGATAASGAAGGNGEHLHLGQRLANTIRSKTGWPDWLILMVISALPVVELRGGVPVGLWMGLPPAQTFTLACIGNFIPVPFILLALNNVPWLLEKVTPTLERKLKDATGTKMNWQALAIFVGVPLPGTGAWTGAALAALFKLSYAESFLGVVAGILSAGAIMTAVVLAGVWGGVGVGVALLASLVLRELGKRRGNRSA